jgi:hypothetical protein
LYKKDSEIVDKSSNDYLILKVSDPFSECVTSEEKDNKSIKVTSSKSKKAQVVKSEENLAVNKVKSGKKPAKCIKQENEDTLGIKYVQSTWEEYAYQIGTQDGPLRYEINENEQPHLEGFVAFDIEYWWAERSMSSMINEMNISSSSTVNQCQKLNPQCNKNYNILQSIIKNNYDINNNNNSSGDLSAMNIASLLISSAKSKASYSHSSCTSSMQINNLQEIYS